MSNNNERNPSEDAIITTSGGSMVVTVACSPEGRPALVLNYRDHLDYVHRVIMTADDIRQVTADFLRLDAMTDEELGAVVDGLRGTEGGHDTPGGYD